VSWQPGTSNVPTRSVVDRIGGTDRIATAVDASHWSYDAADAGGRQANVAVLSRSDNFADALAGNALAAEKHGPLLLTPTAGLDPRVGAELKRTLRPGSTVYVLGGVNALSPQVGADVQALGFTPKRLQGTDRFGSAVAIAQEIAPNGPHTVMVATGINFPDALTAGAAAAQDLAGGVVVLSNGGTLPTSTRNYLAGLDPNKVHMYGVGGQGVAALAASLPSWGGLTTSLSGADRYATAYAVAHSALFGLDGPVTMAGVATGGTWPDAVRRCAHRRAARPAAAVRAKRCQRRRSQRPDDEPPERARCVRRHGGRARRGGVGGRGLSVRGRELGSGCQPGGACRAVVAGAGFGVGGFRGPRP
jgi:putative cell wall-binding protein